jgi:hypothetical protein
MQDSLHRVWLEVVAVKKHVLVMIGVVLLVVVVGGAVAWYLASPLLFDRTVDESFPSVAPVEGDAAQMPKEEGQAAESQVPDTTESMPDKMLDEEMPAGSQPVPVRQGQFRDADSLHRGSGTSTIYQVAEGKYVLRFEDFSVTNGPDLHVLLAQNPSPTGQSDLGEYVDLGKLKGNLGNQNYEISEVFVLTQFQSVVIYCQPFHVVFSVAPMTSAMDGA